MRNLSEIDGKTSEKNFAFIFLLLLLSFHFLCGFFSKKNNKQMTLNGWGLNMRNIIKLSSDNVLQKNGKKTSCHTQIVISAIYTLHFFENIKTSSNSRKHAITMKRMLKYKILKAKIIPVRGVCHSSGVKFLNFISQCGP